MSPRLTPRHLLLAAAAALLSACSSPLAPADSALRTDTGNAAACSGVFGGVSTITCDDEDGGTGTNSTGVTTQSTTMLSPCSGVFGGVSTRECISGADSTQTGQ